MRSARGLGLRQVTQDPVIVVLARDPRFTYRKLTTAANALRHGARLIVTNPDGSHPGRSNSVVPETGALMQALVYASGVEPDEIIGKPEPALLEEASRPEGWAVGRIGTALDLPSATLSFHLKELKHANLVTVRRQGRSLVYAASFSTMTGLIDYLTRHCCAGDPAACGIVPPMDAARKETA